MLLEEDTKCFCFLAGHESFAAAEGAIGIAEKANKVRKEPLRVILNGLCYKLTDSGNLECRLFDRLTKHFKILATHFF